jgi:PTS system nitrogen regulatory IIA component
LSLRPKIRKTGASMKIRDFLSPANVVLDVRANDKNRLLQQLSIQASSELGLDPNEISSQIAKREGLGSTGVGNGVALPHARLRGLTAPFGLLARLHRGLDFEAIDNEPVDIVFLLLLPETGEGAQLNALACAARVLREPEILERVRNAPDREAVFRALADPIA